MARSSYIVNPSNTQGSGVVTEDHTHDALYYTQSQVNANFVSKNGASLIGSLNWDLLNATDEILSAKTINDTFDRISIDTSGRILFGSGTSAGDVAIRRSGLNELSTEGDLVIDGTLTVLGGIVGQSSTDASTFGGNAPEYYLSRGNHTGSQPASTISDFTETVQDVVAQALGAFDAPSATGINVSYDDTTGRITVSYAPPVLTSIDITDWTEAIQDVVGASIVGTGNATVAYNDTTGQLTVNVPTPAYSFNAVVDTPTLNLTDNGNGSIQGAVLDSPTVGGLTPAQLRDRSTHSGTQAASTISDFAEAVSDQVGTMVAGNTETGIAVTYQDSDNTLDFAVAYGTPVGLSNASGTAAGTANTAARADHTHAITGFATTTHVHNDVYYTRAEVDAIIDSLETGAPTGTYLEVSGGTMTGPLTLAANPTTDLQAATKGYVDTNFATKTYSDTTFATQNYVDTTFHTKTYTNNTFATKTYLDSTFLTSVLAATTYTTKAEATAFATTAYVDSNFVGTDNNYVESATIQQIIEITQQDFDALGTYDPYTMYVVVDTVSPPPSDPEPEPPTDVTYDGGNSTTTVFVDTPIDGGSATDTVFDDLDLNP